MGNRSRLDRPHGRPRRDHTVRRFVTGVGGLRTDEERRCRRHECQRSDVESTAEHGSGSLRGREGRRGSHRSDAFRRPSNQARPATPPDRSASPERRRGAPSPSGPECLVPRAPDSLNPAPAAAPVPVTSPAPAGPRTGREAGRHID
jgi:hypothetical protein